MLITLGVEDVLSESVAKRLIDVYAPNVSVAETVGLQGNRQLRSSIRKLNQIANYQRPALVFTDLDRPQSCPPALLREWFGGLKVAPSLLLRVAVLEIESWLLADRDGMAQWLSVATNRVPLHPESVLDPKRTLVELANGSRRRDLREAIVPSGGIGSHRIGPGYNERVSEFALRHWSAETARRHAPSLDRAIVRIAELATRRPR